VPVSGRRSVDVTLAWLRSTLSDIEPRIKVRMPVNVARGISGKRRSMASCSELDMEFLNTLYFSQRFA